MQYRGNNNVRFSAHLLVIGTYIDMKSTIRVLASLAAMSAAICVSSASFAQESAPAAPSAPPSAEAMHQHWAERMQAHQAARAKALHDILNIQPGQEDAFKAFLAAMRPEHRDGMGPGQHPDDQQMAALTTPQRLDRMAARMAARQAEFQHRAEAIKAFYATLTPDQQRAFDALPHAMGHGMHGHHGGPDGFKGGRGEG